MVDPRAHAEMYQRVVQDELGLIATIDEDNDVRFKHPDMGSFFFSLDAEHDPEFLMLVYGAFFDAKQGVSREELRRLCISVNAQCKAAKLSVRDNEDGDVVATIEMFVAGVDQAPDEAHLRAIMRRVLSSLRSAVDRFAEQVKALQA